MGTAYASQRSPKMQGRRKALVGAGLAAAGLAAVAAVRLLDRHPVGNPQVPEPHKPVDLERYLGRWYEIARYEQRFERGCKSATADYSMRPDGNIRVLNRCQKGDGEFEEALGIAKIVDAETNAKLKVSFFRPFYGDYWVIDRGDDYSWSIVGESSGRYLWILSRKPHPGDREVRQLVNRASELGYNTSMLVFDID